MYTREQIIFESEYNAYIEKLSVTTDMLCENCINIMQTTDDADVYMEAKTGLIETVKKFIEGIVKKIKEAFGKLSSKVQEHKNKKSVEELYDPAFKRKIANAKKNGVNYIEEVDVDELIKLLNRSEEFITKSSESLKREADAVARAKSIKNSQLCVDKLNKLTLNLDNEYDKIAKSFDRERHTKRQISLDRIEKMAKQGVDYMDSITETCDAFTKKIYEFQDTIEDVYGSIEDKIVHTESGGVIKRVIHTINLWCEKHRQMLDIAEDIIRGFCTSVAGFGGWAAANGTIRGGKMFLRSFEKDNAKSEDVVKKVTNKKAVSY